jgi:integral membrane protein
MGSEAPLSGVLLRYRIMAYIVGVMLIIVFCAIPFSSVEQVVGPIHGVLYIVYLAAALHLVIRARLGLWTLVAMVTGGWVPFAAFVVERWVTHRLTSTATTH